MSFTSKELDSVAVENFRQYLRIPSVHPNINYDACIEFLEKQANDIGLVLNVYRNIRDKPVVVFTWIGKEPKLPTIMLNSHMDVAPACEDKWNHKPFDADIDESGNIYARGAQDTKSLGIQYLEAIRRLKIKGTQPKRTVHVTFVADEETGGIEGMKDFIKTAAFQKLNIGFALDEGIADESNTLIAIYGEKINWKFGVHCPGQPGHGSLLLDNTAGEKLLYVLQKVYEFRAQQRRKQDREQRTDHITTVNLTMIQGGVQNNVIPSEFTIVFDARIPIDDFNKFEADVQKWCRDAGEGVWIEDYLKEEAVANTTVNDSNPFWVAFKTRIEEMGLKVDPQISCGNSDSNYLRGIGIPTIGFSPMSNTPVKAHDNNEFLNVNVFLAGIVLFTNILPAVANV